MLKANQLEEFSSNKVVSLEKAIELVSNFKKENKTVGLCHGGFDLLHPGHIKHFESAKSLCDLLFVSITSDRFVSSRKGSGRPVFTDKLRAYSVASLASVDYVAITDFAKGVEIIEKLKPSYYIKGPDFIGKTTPGIVSEREAIARVGGEIKYTNDPKLSTTEIIDYVKNQLDVKNLLLVIDRDGTIIKNDDFFGKENNWKEKLELNNPVVNFLSYLQTKYKTTKIVVTNQGGVARKYFSCERVEEINNQVNNLLVLKGVKIDDWQYCPDVDVTYAQIKNNFVFDSAFVKQKTKRKPNSDMVHDSLQKMNTDLNQYCEVLVVGNSEDDDLLAQNLNAKFINVTGKNYAVLLNEFTQLNIF
ncbi:HAD-IIIA family hydrolase [Candidatus Woesearchaeota archaeon]|nr:HAD-IIIA family hydrolase [Candidatus Woesearchaeota archaeon]